MIEKIRRFGCIAGAFDSCKLPSVNAPCVPQPVLLEAKLLSREALCRANDPWFMQCTRLKLKMLKPLIVLRLLTPKAECASMLESRLESHFLRAPGSCGQ